ncbi:MAG: hydantoinase B/oxoprolinase family protein [Deltaproteobacteria bacterium]|nr:MAG: hydantoinase B/oxoprolinase family protein [Deltaproteobacteria bacterium]
MNNEIDPIRYQVFRHRLFNILEEGRIAMGMVSGSPVVAEGGETCTSMHLADGTPTLVAAGILLHGQSTRDFIYKAIELYEEDPGFFDGDQMFFNDPYISGQHPADMVIIKPIFYEKKRVAWTGAIMHTPEVGSGRPANSGGEATNIYQEGIRIQGLKVVEKGKLRRDVFNTITQQTRDPHLVGMDINARIASNNVCARRYLQLIEKFGLDFVEAASRKMIADAEMMVRKKLRRLPDGVWRSRLYADTTGLQEKPFKVVCTMTKKGDEICFDFTGSSPQVEGALNSTWPAVQGSFFVPLCSQLFWEVPWNQGMLAPIKLIAPEGTVINCKYPAACGIAVFTTGCLVQESAHECIAKMLYAGGLIEDVNSAWRGCLGIAPSFEGVNQFDRRVVGVLMHSFCAGIGAAPYRDGVDTGGNMMNPQSNVADEEIVEMSYPFLCLGRSNATDSGGFGKFRGGMGPQMIYMLHGTQEFNFGLTGSARRTPANWGMFGGYPTAVSESTFALDSDLPRWLEESRCPGTFEEVQALGGEIINPPNNSPMIAVKEHDVVIWRLGAGGGYGDPIERDPEKVAEDVRNWVTSIDVARKVYGVVIDPDKLELRKEATDKLRDEIRKERLKKATPVSEWRKRQCVG